MESSNKESNPMDIIQEKSFMRKVTDLKKDSPGVDPAITGFSGEYNAIQPKLPPSPDQLKYRNSPIKQRIDMMKPAPVSETHKLSYVRNVLAQAIMAVSLAFSGSAAEISQHPVKAPYTPPVSESFGGTPISGSLPVTKSSKPAFLKPVDKTIENPNKR